MMEKAYQLESIQLYKTFTKNKKTYPVLKGIDFKVEKGEFVGIMGSSGAGKSTLINLLAGLDHPTEGTVLVEGRDLFRMGEQALAGFRRKRLGFIFQDYNLLDPMTVYENIALPMILAKLPVNVQREKVKALAETFHITHLLDKNPADLSGGEKQRVTAARAIVMDPAIIFADEPTGALDSKSGRELMELLSAMHKERGATILMVTHDLKAARYCDRIIQIEDGVLV